MPLTKAVSREALSHSVANFRRVIGSDIAGRYGPFYEWVNERTDMMVWPYGRFMQGGASDTISYVDRTGGQLRNNHLNFGSQDYLGLAQDPRIAEAAREAIDNFGVHSAGSSALGGQTALVRDVCDVLSEKLSKESCLLYPTGWAAGFGVIVGLVRNDDTVVIDSLAHNCLSEGAHHASRRPVRQFRHNDLEHLRTILQEVRSADARGGLFIVFESLYSMDSDSPNLKRLMEMAREFNAITIMDVAHDLGAMGDEGLGLLENVSPDERPDLIMGSFSKTFAANGGFVAGPEVIRDYLLYFSPSITFTNAISPLQTGVVKECLSIVFSGEGRRLRQTLSEKVDLLRGEMVKSGLTLKGSPSPIVPVFVGDEPTARLTSRVLDSKGLVANLVEFPAVATGDARFRFQLMANHSDDAIRRAAAIMRDARQEAEIYLRQVADLADVRRNASNDAVPV